MSSTAAMGVESESENSTATNANNKSKKPKDSSFKQQRLPAWQPILTAGTVLPAFFVIGVAFIPIGIGMLWFSDNVMEIERDYTQCTGVVNGVEKDCAKYVNDAWERANNASSNPDMPQEFPQELRDNPCICSEDFTVDTDWEDDTYLYYGLTNFYQNHRRYVKSRDDLQLFGDSRGHPSGECGLEIVSAL